MTALGLAVAVPAVLAYNWLIRRNKAVIEDLAKFSNDLHGYMMSGGAVRPVVTTRPATSAAGATPRAAQPGAAGPGGTTATGSATGTTTSGPKKV
jgi:biopolymer transport protein ExbB